MTTMDRSRLRRGLFGELFLDYRPAPKLWGAAAATTHEATLPSGSIWPCWRFGRMLLLVMDWCGVRGARLAWIPRDAVSSLRRSSEARS